MRTNVLLPLLALACTPVGCMTSNDSKGVDDGTRDDAREEGYRSVSASNVDISGTGGRPSQTDQGGPVKGAGDPCRGVALADDQHFVAPGLCARAIATQQGRLRQITFAPNGDLFGVTVEGSIRRYRDADRNGTFEPSEVIEYASTGGNGNNVHIDVAGGFLYGGSPEGVRRWPYAPERTSGGDGELVVTGQPSTGHHFFHTTHVFDGWLYVHSGSENNFVAPMLPDYDTNRSLIRRFDLSRLTPGTPFQWQDGEIFALGLRNTVGFTRTTGGRIYAVNNAMDNLTYDGRDIHDDNPGEEVFLLEKGRAYGYPYCFTANLLLRGPSDVTTSSSLVPPGTMLKAQGSNADAPNLDFTNPHDDRWCAAHATRAVTYTPPHSAPLDIAFFDDAPAGGLPERYRRGAFIALHGSWNREPPSGYRVVFVPFDASGNARMPVVDSTCEKPAYEVIFGGGTKEKHVDGPWRWSSQGVGERLVRPVGVAISPVDGALYVSSDNAPVFGVPQAQPGEPNGALYRIGRR